MTRISSIVAVIVCASFVASCSAVSPHVRIENRLVEFGFSEERAECMAEELDDRLDREDMKAVADFVGDLNAADSAGETLDALLGIDNSRAAGAIAAAGVSCAF